MKYFKLLLIIAAGGVLIHSCNKDYLDKNPLGRLEETDVANKKGVEGLLIGAYSLLDGFGGFNLGDIESAASNWLYGTICGSEAYSGAFGGEFKEIEKFKPLANFYAFAVKWGLVYDGVQRANEVLRVMKKASDISAEDEERISGEARFLRAFYHFEAAKMWGKVPFVDETVTYVAHNYRLSNDTLIWSAIENDLIYAVNNIPITQPAVGRANKYAAKALLAKAYMFDHQYLKAQPLLQDIITNGVNSLNVKYDLVKNYADNFNAETKNNEESIFAAQMSVNDGSELGFNGNYGNLFNYPNLSAFQPAGAFQPSQYLVNHFKTDLVSGLPDVDNKDTIPVTSDQGVESGDPFTPYAGTLDPRLDWTVGRREIPYLDWGDHQGKNWIQDQDLGGPYSPKKNVFYKYQKGMLTQATGWNINANAINVNLIRFADVLLWAAEVEVEMGNLDQAQEYVNRVRNRAKDPSGWVHTYIDPADPSKGFTNIPAAHYYIMPYPNGYFTSKGQDYARKAVRYERMLELGMEGHRFFDLVRWGIADTEINDYLAKEKKLRKYLNDATFTKGRNEVFPIPQEQIDLSAGADGVAKLKQNPGY